MDFRILGSLEVWDGERQLELGGPKRRAVLAFLLLHANEVVAVDRLVDQLWGEKAPRNAAAALHTHVSRLRKELGPEIIARRAWGYVLRAEPGALDLQRFELLVADAENLPARQRAEKLREGLALWRGAPLEDLAFEPALAGDIARLDALRLSVLENRIDADLEAGNDAGLVGELEVLITQYPLRERLRGQLILTLYRGGRQAEALEVYRETRRVLAEELGLEPSPELRELERAILQQDPALRASVGGAEAAVVAAEPGVRPGRRRRIFIGASLALLLVGLGTAAAYAVSTRTQQAAPGHSTSVTTGPPTTSEPTTTGQGGGTSSGGSGTTSGKKNKSGGGGSKKVTTSKTKSGTGSTGSTHITTTVGVVSGGHHVRRLVTISDTFATDYVKPTSWSRAMYGNDVSLFQQDGRLRLLVGANAVPGGPLNQIDVHVATRCSFPGNFDARVDYKFLEWQPADNIEVGMNATFGAMMRDYSSQYGDEYASWVGPTSDSVPLPATGGSMGGSLRIARVNNIEKTYYWHGAGWVKGASSRALGPAVIKLQAVSDGENLFGGEELLVAFDNFSVTGAHPSCPPGARPSR
jgi:DNA-binding SARP family transcriptional activator